MGARREIDPGLLVGDPSLSVAEGVLLPWSGSSSQYYDQIIKAVAERYEIDMSTPWRDLPEEVRDIFLYGTKGERLYVSYVNRAGLKRSYMTTFEGIVPNLERRYRETDSDYMREKIEEYMADRPCPACDGARLKPSTLAVTHRGAEYLRTQPAAGHGSDPVPGRTRAEPRASGSSERGCSRRSGNG